MKPKETKIVVFADLDGTILDENYELADVEPILLQLLSMGASIVFSSSKTRFEIEFYRKSLAIHDPFIVENGSAIFIPKDYFKALYECSRQKGDYNVIELGCEYSAIREKLSLIKKRTGASFVGFGDMNLQSVAEESGMPLKLAYLAKMREYDEPLKISPENEAVVLRKVVEEGLCYTKGGRFYHILGNCDKGKAVTMLKDLYSQAYGKITTIGVGDSENDLSMLKVVDNPFWINKRISKCEQKTIWLQILTFAACLNSR